MAADETKITRSEARATAQRLRLAIAHVDTPGMVRVIRKTLTPEDLATLETFAGLLIERASKRNV